MGLRPGLVGIEDWPRGRETVGSGLPRLRKDQRPFILSISGGADHTEIEEKIRKLECPVGLLTRKSGRWDAISGGRIRQNSGFKQAKLGGWPGLRLCEGPVHPTPATQRTGQMGPSHFWGDMHNQCWNRNSFEFSTAQPMSSRARRRWSAGTLAMCFFEVSISPVLGVRETAAR